MDRKETIGKASLTATALAERIRDARLDERAAELAAVAREKVRDAELDAKAAELAALIRARLHEAGVDEKAAELVARMRDTGVAQQAGETAATVAGAARDAADRTLDRMGDWLGEGAVGERLGLQRRRRRRRWPLAVGAAVAAGIAAGFVAMRSRQDDTGEVIADPVQRTTAPGTALPLEGRVREALGQDPRTSSVPPLNVNVVDGTVFVRGSVGPDVDQDVLRNVIQGVEGVTDVDLQVTVTA